MIPLPRIPISRSMFRYETPCWLASDFGNRCPIIMIPYRNTGTRKHEICIRQSSAFSRGFHPNKLSPVNTVDSSPPTTSPAGHPACRMFR